MGILILNFNKKWSLGLIMLAIVIFLWVLSSFLINLIFENDLYRKPFFITYLNTSTFIFYLLPTLKNIIDNYRETGNFHIHQELLLEEEGLNALDSNNKLYFRQEDSQSGQNQLSDQLPITDTSPLLTPKSTTTNNTSNHNNNNSITENNLENQISHNSNKDNRLITNTSIYDRLSLPETIKLSAQFCILWFLANFATNASLAYTSVASQTILSSTSSFFTLFVGALCNVESINKLKLVGSIISFIGILLVTHSDTKSNLNLCKDLNVGQICIEFINSMKGNSNNNTFFILIGNLLALLGALFYGVYSTLLKLKVKNEDRINMNIFFGFVGLFTMLFLWPSLVLLHYLGWETFEWPQGKTVISIITINCIITFISDFCWAKAMLLTSPLTVTVGLSITIPVAMFGDLVFKHKSMSTIYVLGAVLILGSFFIISKSSEEEHLDRALEDDLIENTSV